MKSLEVLYDEPLHTAPPPGKSLEAEDTIIKKGDVLAYYNEWVDAWHVKRVVRAGRATPTYGGQVRQSDIKYVSHDAVPEEGKDGTASSHYPSGSGFGQINTYQLSRDGGQPWWLVDVNDPRTAGWIAATDQIWADYHADERAEKERVAGTPLAFSERMESRAKEAERMADAAESLAASFRVMATSLRAEKPGKWVK